MILSLKSKMNTHRRNPRIYFFVLSSTTLLIQAAIHCLSFPTIANEQFNTWLLLTSSRYQLKTCGAPLVEWPLRYNFLRLLLTFRNYLLPNILLKKKQLIYYLAKITIVGMLFANYIFSTKVLVGTPVINHAHVHRLINLVARVFPPGRGRSSPAEKLWERGWPVYLQIISC